MIEFPITHALRSNMSICIPLDVYFHKNDTMCMQLTHAITRVDLGVVDVIVT